MQPDQLQIQGIDPLEGQRFLVRKRDGRIEEFNEARILLAIESAFRAHHGFAGDQQLPENLASAIRNGADSVVERVLARAVRGEELEVERIQDAVEDQLMQAGHFEVARRYILYREQRRQARAEREGRARPWQASTPAGSVPPPGPPKLRDLYSQTFAKPRPGETLGDLSRRYFDCYVNEAEYFHLLSPSMLDYDTGSLARSLCPERDAQFRGEGLSLLQSRYLLRGNNRLLETPQYFWMRIAMGLASREQSPEARAIEFYDVLSSFRFVPADPILLHAGSARPRFNAVLQSPAGWHEIWDRAILDDLDPSVGGQKGIWLRDLFLQRVKSGGNWMLFKGAESAELAECSAAEFETRYLQYEQKAARGELNFAKSLTAAALWREITGAAMQTQLQLAFRDTAHKNRITFGGAFPAGVINLSAHIARDGSGVDLPLLRQTIALAVRMLDNAVDLEAGSMVSDRRAISLGLAGLPEALARFCTASMPQNPPEWAGRMMELISCHAHQASSQLAMERGAFPACSASKYSEGRLPADMAPASTSLNWDNVRSAVRRHGMRNDLVIGNAVSGGPLVLTSMTPLPGIAPAIDAVAHLQRWMDIPLPLLPPADEKERRVSKSWVEAWQKGVVLIECRGETQSLTQTSPPAPAEMVETTAPKSR